MIKLLPQVILLITLSAVTVVNLQSQTYWEKAGDMSKTVNVLHVHGNGTLYAGTSGEGLLASTDQGNTWDSIDGPPETDSPSVLSLAENSPGQLVVGTDQGIWLYLTDQDRWEDNIQGGLKEDIDVTSILAIGEEFYLIGTEDGIFVKKNRDENWSPNNRGIDCQIEQVQALFLTRTRIYVGLDCGIYYTDRNINTESEWQRADVSGSVYAIDGFDNGNVLAGVDSRIEMTSVDDDGLLTWGDAPFPLDIGDDVVRSICVTDIGTVFAATRREGVFTSDNYGLSPWLDFNNGLAPDVLINSLTKAPDGVLYLATDTGVYRTRRTQTEIVDQYLGPGDAIVTCNDNPGETNSYVLGIMKVRNADIQPRNENWQPPMYHHPTWTSDILGDIFSICTDTNGNIYVAATSIYPGGQTDVGMGGAGAVYKIEAVTNEVSVYIETLDSSAYDPNKNAIPNTGPGLGSIAYDFNNKQLFVSNFEDGCIYRIQDDPENPGKGKIADRIDPLEPDNRVPGHAPKGDLIWGLGVNKGRLFYSVWSEDEFESFNVRTERSNSIRSYALLPDGTVDESSDELNIDMAEYSLDNGNFTSPVSDIEFNVAGDEMLLAERSMRGFKSNAHKSRIMRFVKTENGSWQKSSSDFTPGTIFTNIAAGGCDFGYGSIDDNNNFVACDSTVWFSVDAFRASWEGREEDGNIYGFAMMPLGGGGNRDAVVIDADGDTTNNVVKRNIGDIDIYTARCGTLQISCDDITRNAVRKISSKDPDDLQCCWELVFSMEKPESLHSMRLRVLSPGIRFSAGGVDVAEWGVASLDEDAVVYNILPNPEVVAGEQNSVTFCLETDQDIDPTQLIEVQWFGIGGSPCRDIIEVNCPPGTNGQNCGELVEISEAECVSNLGGVSHHSVRFTIKNNSDSLIRTIHVRPPAGFANAGIFPRDIVLDPPLNAGVSYTTDPIDIFGLNLDRDSSIAFRFAISTDREYYCCAFVDTLRFEKCISCCQNSPVRVAPSSPLERVNGQVALQVPLRRNSRAITQMTATVVSSMLNSCMFTERWTPVGGNIVRAPEQWNRLPRVDMPRPESQLSAGLTFDNGGTVNTRFDCVSYGYVPGGVLPVEPLVLRLEFPQVADAGGCSEDTLYFAMRYQFTDVNCVTCDTLVWYYLTRNGTVFDDPLLAGPPLVTGNSKLNSADVIQSGRGPGSDAGFASLVMQDNNSGVLTIRTGNTSEISIEGFRFETDQNIRIVNFDPPPGVCPDFELIEYQATVNCGAMEEGEHDFNVRFNRNGATAFNCKLYVQLSYTDALDGEDGPDIVEKEFSVILDSGRKDSIRDDVSTDVNRARVLLFALQLDNRNQFNRDIHYARIKLSEGAKILAVGPGVADSCVDLEVVAYEDNEYLVPWTANLRRTGLMAGDSIAPIYLVASVTDTNVRSVSVVYQTLDENQSVISEVESEYTNPITTVRQKDFPDSPAFVVNDFGLNLRPNPAGNSVVVNFELDQYRNNVGLTILDMSGKVVAEVWTNRSLSGGLHEVQVQTDQLPAGSYFVNLQVGGMRSSRTLSVVR